MKGENRLKMLLEVKKSKGSQGKWPKIALNCFDLVSIVSSL